MARLANPQNKEIKHLIFLAKDKGLHIVDFEKDPKGNELIAKFKASFYNYKRKLKKNKLSPEFINDWLIMERCKIFSINETKLIIIYNHV